MIRLRTLGAFDLRGSGGEELRAVLAQPRRAAVLAYLALSMPRGAHRRDTVLALFWPELDVDRARNALGQAVHFLRRSIGADAVVNRSGDGLAVDWSNFWCDAAAFEEALDANRVGEALALYRGDLLEGFHIADAPEFERWLESERVRLAARYTKAVEALATELEAAGDCEGAVTHWRALAVRDPYTSRLTLRLMRALRAAGDPAGAIVQARQHERLLRDEFAIAPDAEVAALVRQLQSEQPKQTSPAPTPASAQSENDLVRVTEQPAAQESPVDAPRPRRRTATFTIGLLAIGGMAAAAVLKSASRVPVPPAPVPAPATVAGEAVPKDAALRDLYVRGRNAERSRSEVGLATARDAYERAIGLDSTFALGYAGLATAYGLLGHYGFMRVRPALDSARLLARRAVELDSTIAATRTALAVTLADAGRFEAAEREFQRAILLDSSEALAHQWYSVLLVALGRGEEALREAQLAEKFDPLVSRAVLAMQRYATWLITGERPYLRLPVRDRRPFLKGEPGDPWPLARQAEDLAQAGDCAEARKDIDRALNLAPDNARIRPEIGRVEWWCGERPRARALLDDMKRRSDARDNGLHVAQLHTLFNENDSAFVWLGHHRQWTVVELAILSAGHQLDPLRSDPRYPRLLRSLGVRK